MKKIRRKPGRGFTLVEVMIVVLIIGILLNIALPNFVNARESARSKGCTSNLKALQGAKEQWALATNAGDIVTPSWTTLTGTGRYLRVRPACPSGGTYALRPLTTNPSCTIGTNGAGASDDHVLQ